MPSTPENSRVHLYFFRHGETEWNRLKIFQGSHDIPLNETGRLQARNLADAFDNLPIEVVLSSDLSRARETTDIAFQHRKDLPCLYTPALREADLGVAEGVPRSLFDEKFGEEMWDAWISPQEEFLDFKFPEGETKRETRQRVLDFLNDFIAQNAFKHIAVSTHGGVISRIVHYCQNSPTGPTPIPNGCLYHVRVEAGVWSFVGRL